MKSPEYQHKVQDFLNLKSIAVAGYSRGSNPGNAIYDKLKNNGYKVYAINPNADQINGIKCYASLSDIPEKVEGVVVTAPPAATEKIVEDCGKLGIKNLWIHRSMDNGSYSKEAVTKAKSLGINTISIGCPMMFLKPDIFHRCFRWVMDVRGKLQVE